VVRATIAVGGFPGPMTTAPDGNVWFNNTNGGTRIADCVAVAGGLDGGTGREAGSDAAPDTTSDAPSVVTGAGGSSGAGGSGGAGGGPVDASPSDGRPPPSDASGPPPPPPDAGRPRG